MISRRDRSDQENRGGIISFARVDVFNIVCVKVSADAERSWHYLHLDHGTIAICNWYRPGSSDDDHITSLRGELEEIRSEVIGCIIMGDCNIHHSRWLHFSNGNTPEGSLLKDICDDHGLQQLVRKPTRGDYLLDLLLTDLDDCKIEVFEEIADHKGILAKFSLPCPK